MTDVRTTYRGSMNQNANDSFNIFEEDDSIYDSVPSNQNNSMYFDKNRFTTDAKQMNASRQPQNEINNNQSGFNAPDTRKTAPIKNNASGLGSSQANKNAFSKNQNPYTINSNQNNDFRMNDQPGFGSNKNTNNFASNSMNPYTDGGSGIRPKSNLQSNLNQNSGQNFQLKAQQQAPAFIHPDETHPEENRKTMTNSASPGGNVYQNSKPNIYNGATQSNPQIDDLRYALADKNKEVERLKRELEYSSGGDVKIKKRMAQLENEKELLQEEINNQNKIRITLENEIENLQAENALNQQIKNRNAILQAENNSQLQEITRLRNDNDGLKNNVLILKDNQKNITEMEIESNRLRKQIIELNDRIRYLEEEKATVIAQERSKTPELAMTIEKLRDENLRLQERNSVLGEEVKNTRNSFLERKSATGGNSEKVVVKEPLNEKLKIENQELKNIMERLEQKVKSQEGKIQALENSGSNASSSGITAEMYKKVKVELKA